MLPSFISQRSNANLARRASRVAAAGGWRQEPDHQAQECRRRAAADAKAHAGVRLLGNLMLTAFMALALCMAGVALHQEQRLEQMEQQGRLRGVL